MDISSSHALTWLDGLLTKVGELPTVSRMRIEDGEEILLSNGRPVQASEMARRLNAGLDLLRSGRYEPNEFTSTARRRKEEMVRAMLGCELMMTPGVAEFAPRGYNMACRPDGTIAQKRSSAL